VIEDEDEEEDNEEQNADMKQPSHGKRTVVDHSKGRQHSDAADGSVSICALILEEWFV
jgi:hypothetical protein